MKKNDIKLTFAFLDPNTPGVFQEALKKILLEKILSTF